MHYFSPSFEDLKSLHTTYQSRDFMEDFEDVSEIEERSINVKFVKLFILLESLAFSFRFITFNNITDELDFEG